MAPAVTAAADVRAAFTAAGKHLDTYAGELEAIRPRLVRLEARARTFRAAVVGGVWVDAADAADASWFDHLDWFSHGGRTGRQVKVPWNQDDATNAKNTALVTEYGQILADLSAAAAACASSLESLAGVCLPLTGAIPVEAFVSPEADLPFGSPAVEDRNCRESVGNGIYTFGKELGQGVGALIFGYNPQTDDWLDGGTYGQAWMGVANLVTSIAIVGSATLRPGGIKNPDAITVDAAYTVQAAAGALVGWDPNAKDGWHKWHEDGISTGVSSVLGIATFFVPVADVGGALKVGSVGARAAVISGTAAEFAIAGGSWVVRGAAKVVVGLRDAVKLFDLDSALATARPGVVLDAAAGLRLNPAALVNAIDDASHAATRLDPSTPLSDAAFGRDTHATTALADPRVHASGGESGAGPHTGSTPETGAAPRGDAPAAATPDDGAPAGHSGDPAGTAGDVSETGRLQTDADVGQPGTDAPANADGRAVENGTAEPLTAARAEAPPSRDNWEPPSTNPRPFVERTVTLVDTAGELPGPQTPFARRSDLLPDTLYQVTTRSGIESDFYTDASGKVVYVETTYGKSGALNWDLVKPQPEVTYVVHPHTEGGSGTYTHVFRMDEAGRTVAASTDDLQRGLADRSPSIQQRVGSVGTAQYGIPYEGGHLLANMFGGGPESANLVAMMESVNRGKAPSFSSLERLWDESIAQGKKVEVDVIARYGDPGTVPTRVTVRWTIDGVPYRRVFGNVPS
ncbi:DNA/RNA non-specific endonuclease [Cellulomonas sp. URHB0016]